MQYTQSELQLSKKGRDNSLRHVSAYSLLAILMILFVMTTLLQALFDRISINKLLGIAIAGVAFWIWSTSLSVKRLCGAYLLGSAGFFVIITSENVGLDFTEWIYFYISMLILTLVSNPYHAPKIYNAFSHNKTMMRIIIWLSTCVLCFLLVFRIGYKYKWGEGSYFVGLCNSEHTLASVCCLILALIYSYTTVGDCNKGIYGLLSLIPAFAIFQSGARIFLVPLAVIGYLYIRKNIKRRSVRVIIYIIGALGFAYVLLNSSMMEKFLYAFDNQYGGTILDTFTSGRTEIWATELNLFSQSNILKKIFGGSFASIYTANKSNLGLSIGAHNDLIGLLCGTGLLGLFLYICVLTIVVRNISRLDIPKLCRLLLCAYIIVPMCFNGFYPYQHYVYSFVILFLSVQKTENLCKHATDGTKLNVEGDHR